MTNCWPLPKDAEDRSNRDVYQFVSWNLTAKERDFPGVNKPRPADRIIHMIEYRNSGGRFEVKAAWVVVVGLLLLICNWRRLFR